MLSPRNTELDKEKIKSEEKLYWENCFHKQKLEFQCYHRKTIPRPPAYESKKWMRLLLKVYLHEPFTILVDKAEKASVIITQ